MNQKCLEGSGGLVQQVQELQEQLEEEKQEKLEMEKKNLKRICDYTFNII